MTDLLKKVWGEVFLPMMRRPAERQVAALCWRERDGKREVLLVTSRGTGRWILPKGWHDAGMTASDAAAREAWEEAGVTKGKVEGEPMGSYGYSKTLDSGMALPIKAEVFGLKVKKTSKDFPESDERLRKWVSPAEAADLVDEPELQRLLRAM